MDTDLSHEALERFDDLDKRVKNLEKATGLAADETEEDTEPEDADVEQPDEDEE